MHDSHPVSAEHKQKQPSSSLDEFRLYLEHNNMSANTIRSYLYAVWLFQTRYPTISHDYMMLYKCYLIERYKPQTVNLRIRAMNCYIEFLNQPDEKVLMVRTQKKSFLENVISEADYEYLKNCLLRDEQIQYYFTIRMMADTGMRISELVKVDVTDVRRGYIDLTSKGNRARRVYIPHIVRDPCLEWLDNIGRTKGAVFRNKFNTRISTTGIRDQLKVFAARYNLDPEVVYPHAFRHLFAKKFIERCDDIAMLSDILGHGSIETTRIYLHRSYTEQQQIFNQVVDW